MSTINRKPRDKTCPFGCCTRSGLNEFLLETGFVNGFCSDITVRAFGSEYKLHKLLLSRSGYFRTLFEGSWADCDASSHELIFDDLDYISQDSFEMAISLLYGGQVSFASSRSAMQMISTGQFLGIPELVCMATDSIIQDLNFQNVAQFANFAYNQKLGSPSERILESVRALLCTEGWENGIKKWDNIPAAVMVDVLGSDSFFVYTEWDRCIFIIKLIERRIEAATAARGTLHTTRSLFFEPGNDTSAELETCLKTSDTAKSSRSLSFSSYTSEATATAAGTSGPTAGTLGTSGTTTGPTGPTGTTGTTGTTSASADLPAELQLPESWQEQVAALKKCLNEKVHFCHMDFEQLELLEQLRDAQDVPFIESAVLRDAFWVSSQLQRKIVKCEAKKSELGLTRLSDKKPAKSYLVPVTDETIYATPKQLEAIFNKNQSVLSDNDVARDNTSDGEFEESTKDSDGSPGAAEEAFDAEEPAESKLSPRTNLLLETLLRKKSAPKRLYKWATYPPFRFSVAFEDVSMLAADLKVYSRTLWYAGSYWNLYLQKIKKHKRYQVGVYLHRALNNGAPKSGILATDPLRGMDVVNGISERLEKDTMDYSSDSSSSSLSETFPEIAEMESTNASTVDAALDGFYKENGDFVSSYDDKREKTSIYFVIKTPSRKMKSNLTCFTSKPCTFTVSQSWGWKSNTMCAFREDGTLMPGQNKILKFMVVMGSI